MEINLINLLKDQVGAQLAGPAASFLGESEDNVSKAISGILPSILGGMIDKGNDRKGASGLLNMLNSVDSNLLGNIGSIFSGGNTGGGLSGLLTNGSSILGLLFGDNKLGSLIDLIGSMSGMKKSSSSSLMKLAAPFIMSVIGNKVKDLGLDALGLSKLLGNQKKHVNDALPAGFGNILGIANLGEQVNQEVHKAKEEISNTVKHKTSSTTTTEASSMLKWLLPALLVLAALWFIIGRGCNGAEDIKKDIGDATEKVVDKTKEVTEATVDNVGDAANAITKAAGDAIALSGDALKNVFSAVDQTAKAAWDKLELATGSLGYQLREFANSGFEKENRFYFKNLTFATGSADISKESAQEIDHLAQFLKTYTGTKVIIEGHTDNTGNAATNVQLSKARAQAVKDQLLAQNIGTDRVLTEGYGSSYPTASNETAEGREANRRIEVRIVK